MVKTYNEELFDAMVRHQIGLLRFSGSVRNRIWELLDATEADLTAEIRRRVARAGFDTPARMKRLEVLLDKLREVRKSGWKKANAAWFDEMKALAVTEANFTNGILAASFPVELGTVLPDAARLRGIAKAQPFMGKTLREWGKKIEFDDLTRIESAVKIGMVQGEGPDQIARRLVGTMAQRGRDGVTQVTRRQAASIVRTVTNGIASESRREFMLANDDVVAEWVFTATLDARTTPICRRYDGQKFKVGEGPRLPLHFNERSIGSPAIDGQVIGDRPRRDFTQAQLVREFAKERGLKVRGPRGQTHRAGRQAIPRGHRGAFDKWSRDKMRERTGTTPAKTTYGEWLKRQSAAEQDDILGATRGKLFRRGGLKLDKFVERDGSELTLADLASRHAAAFERAGLDPARYL